MEEDRALLAPGEAAHGLQPGVLRSAPRRPRSSLQRYGGVPAALPCKVGASRLSRSFQGRLGCPTILLQPQTLSTDDYRPESVINGHFGGYYIPPWPQPRGGSAVTVSCLQWK